MQHTEPAVRESEEAARVGRPPRPARREGDHRDDGYDVFGLHPRALNRAIALGRPLYERYFRVTSRGAEHIPPDGPAILVANHSGILPVDGALLCLDVLRRTKPRRIPRAIADRFVPLLPFVSTIFARLGAVSGTRGNVRRLLEQGELLLIFPEGTSGTAKPFRRRYQLQDWRVGHAELALRYRAPVIPVAVLGAEESWPLLARVSWFHAFGVPYLPVPATPLPLPVRYHIRYGAPLDLGRELGADAPDAADDPAMVVAGAARVRSALEAVIARGLAERKELFR